MTLDAAETLALKALAWLVNSPDDLGRFLNVSGCGTEELRRRASDPVFLAAVLAFLLSEDGLLGAFCEAESVDHKHVHMAAHVLEGG
ncbi:MAG: DUF3572 domain-containing protein [Rhizomicrobium sp.]